MNYEKLLISPDASVKKALQLLDETAEKILLVSHNKTLLGVLTDGDIRRWILKNGNLNDPVRFVMNANPIVITPEYIKDAKKLMNDKKVEALPVVNAEFEIVDIVFRYEDIDQKREFQSINNPVVIMAGGKGSRLYPITKVLPKPLIPIGEIPIVERIINNFTKYGCKDFYLTVNYKKNMIKAYFEEVNKDYTLTYVEEEIPLGTAGSLSYLREKIKTTFFMSNCDILVEGNYYDMLKYHRINKNKITIITSVKNYVIPYGIVEVGATSSVNNILEKPEYNFLVNTGFYIIEPETLDAIPNNTPYNITDLISSCLANGYKVGTFPVSEKSWLDMGQFEEMRKMIGRLEK